MVPTSVNLRALSVGTFCVMIRRTLGRPSKGHCSRQFPKVSRPFSSSSFTLEPFITGHLWLTCATERSTRLLHEHGPMGSAAARAQASLAGVKVTYIHPRPFPCQVKSRVFGESLSKLSHGKLEPQLFALFAGCNLVRLCNFFIAS